MGIASERRFCVHHALRIKGFAKVEMIADLAGVNEDTATAELKAMEAEGLTAFKEARGLWQLTPDGRATHAEALESDSGRDGFREGIARSYGDFLHLNEDFKALCGDWQLRNGEPNDHTDAAYDKTVLDRLDAIDLRAQPLVIAMAEVADRYKPYSPRLTDSLAKLHGGNQKMFTGVMCGSYHDVWMELHEDLILTQKIDRAAEGSF
jgi:hypothetical protein